MDYIIALDQGTTSSRAVLFDKKGQVCGIVQKEFTQHFPQPGWVEHDPLEIWKTQYEVFDLLIKKQEIEINQIRALGITNQRETTIVWDADTSEPVYNAIVWQDKRTSDFCDELKCKGLEGTIRSKTGLVLDSYFSATKIKWILAHVPGMKERAKSGKLRFGTVDTWLIWKLTKGKSFVTDKTNASRTLLYNIVDQKWDAELLEIFDIPESLLPEVLPSSSEFGSAHYQDKEIPILGVAGDQQAALFGQACHHPGDVKNTYGTGCFMLMNMGDKFVQSKKGLLTTMACSFNEAPVYALEGSIFIAGAAIQWLRDALELFKKAEDSEALAMEVEGHEVVLVPAFAGLGAPYWDQYSRGAMFGLTRGTTKKHIAKAALESIAFQTMDVLMAMEEDAGLQINNLFVDGGATANDYLMQFQADILNVTVDRPSMVESSALGAAFLAGLKAGIWERKSLSKVRKTERKFIPGMNNTERKKLYNTWKKAVNRTLGWLNNHDSYQDK